MGESRDISYNDRKFMRRMGSLARIDQGLAKVELEDVKPSGEFCSMCGKHILLVNGNPYCIIALICQINRLYLNGFKPKLYSESIYQILEGVANEPVQSD